MGFEPMCKTADFGVATGSSEARAEFRAEFLQKIPFLPLHPGDMLCHFPGLFLHLFFLCVGVYLPHDGREF